jgi:hypothetical protein
MGAPPSADTKVVMSPLLTSSVAFVCILGGAVAGFVLRRTLPEHHLTPDTKDVVRLGTGLVATIAGLVLGLLIASANSNYETQSGQVKELASNIALLDTMLEEYGTEATPLRRTIRNFLPALTERIWRENGRTSGEPQPFEASTAGLSLYAELLKLAPKDDVQRALLGEAIDTAKELAKTRLALFTRSGGPIPVPFLVVLVFWLVTIFASFTLFADHNATTAAAVAIFALSAAAAIFLILELSQPFVGLLMISDSPLRHALAALPR